jgi:hypothetical protein
MAAPKSKFEKVLDQADRFIKARKGAWEHADWEGFLARVEKLGVELTDETKRYLGNILEAGKHFYNADPPKPKAKTKKKTKSKSKAKTKAKRKTKAKTKAKPKSKSKAKTKAKPKAKK